MCVCGGGGGGVGRPMTQSAVLPLVVSFIILETFLNDVNFQLLYFHHDNMPVLLRPSYSQLYILNVGFTGVYK